MEFIPKPRKGFIGVRFVEGSLNTFTGKELRIAYGEKKSLSRRKLILLMRKVVATARQNRIKNLDINWKDIRAFVPKDISNHDLGELSAVAFVMADYEHVAYKAKPKEGFAKVEAVAVRNTPDEGKEGFWRGYVIGTEVNAARELSNTPGGDMTPKKLTAAATAAAKGTSVKVTALGRAQMQRLGMGAVLGVAKGSAEEPQFIIMEYRGGPRSQKPAVLIGKGVTFDTGGLQIKGGDHMYEMHMDMSGGAAVIQTLVLAAKLKVKANVVGLIPAVENAPAANAMRPGDILKSLSGKTIEILHTDAEGRVILADAITYAKRYSPAGVVDVATLTGASLIALGTQASALMSNDREFEDLILEQGELSGDYVWPFPLWEEYEEMTKGKFGDVPNISTAGNSRYGGVIAGGMFLLQFAKDLGCPFAHLDIAPRMTAAPNEFLSPGAAGAPVRLLLKLVEEHALFNK